LDDVDRKIISQLQLDGRTTFERLANIVGFSNMGVKKRVDKLLEKGVITVSTLVNAERLNLHAALVLMEIEDAEAVNRLLARFKECPRVVNIFTTLGGYNLIALVVAEDRNTLQGIPCPQGKGDHTLPSRLSSLRSLCSGKVCWLSSDKSLQRHSLSSDQKISKQLPTRVCELPARIRTSS